MGSELSSPLKKAKGEETAPTEQEVIEDWRRRQFRVVLGDEAPADDVEVLTRSEADLGEARKLKDDGCPSDLIVKILA